MSSAEPKVAVVTGAARGIGRSVAAALLEVGWRCAVTDIQADLVAETARELHPDGSRCLPVVMDVTASDSVIQAVTRIGDELGPISGLVNNAGWDEHHLFVDTDEDFWRRVVEVNYLGVLRTCKAIVPGMIDRGRGAIVNIASDAGRVGSTGEAVYSGAKGAVIAFTKSLARETARAGLNVNCVCPGPTETPLVQEMRGDPDYDRLISAIVKATPFRRFGQPHEIATAVRFLIDESGFITGQTLSVSGGLTMV
ncbi:MAG: SDR family oxidoreductase [Actinomycetota bacterium]|nr:SDR family oxidoreductase [Actinomycetota bacterium]